MERNLWDASLGSRSADRKPQGAGEDEEDEAGLEVAVEEVGLAVDVEAADMEVAAAATVGAEEEVCDESSFKTFFIAV